MTRKRLHPRSGGVEHGTGSGSAWRILSASRVRRWLPWLLLAYLLVAGLFVAWAKMETTQLTYEVHQLRAERADLQRQQRLLGAQLAELRAPAHLTAQAEELGLVEPPPGAIIRLE